MSADYYYTIEKPSVAEYKDRGSKFIAYAFPVQTVDDCKERLAEIKKEHPKATHHCYAYRLGTDGNIFRMNDDGEPSGTAGKPILGKIDSKKATNILVIVARYFGGTLLGTSGLINAYKTATSMALQITPVVQKPVLINYRLQFAHLIMNDVMKIVKKNNCLILKQENELFCIIDIAIPKSRLEETLYLLKEIQNLEINSL